ncbi:MAG: Pyrophosphate--fructose 6-phosphate 1-phosphotransferase [Candidatus Omnitrophica bacterium ADurb.Bin277]|nr:MAG: Pyrophosphate--fructose 6-phosphate 1-phosphotransferase [Candidatus Omnitrophica bacterium ADurb.Bin277]
MKRIGMLTGGGDCPGLNAVLRAIVWMAKREGWTCIGFRQGWKGIIEDNHEELTMDSVSGILPRGGTILRTSRTNPYKNPGDVERVREAVKKNRLDALIAIGGEDTLGAGHKLFKDGVPVIGVPKTIDNDLSATDYTFGYDTALNIATNCIDRLHTTADSHNRVMVAEIMGRHAGWIALESGLAGGADVILIPEVPMTADEICDFIIRRHKRGKNFSIVAVAEGFSIKGEDLVTTKKELDAFGHVMLGGVGDRLSKIIEKKTGFETRCTVLGHIQRGGSPTAFDRVLGTRFGVKAFELAKFGKFGYMAALRGRDIVEVPLADAVGALKTVPMDLYETAKMFFG